MKNKSKGESLFKVDKVKEKERKQKEEKKVREKEKEKGKKVRELPAKILGLTKVCAMAWLKSFTDRQHV